MCFLLLRGAIVCKRETSIDEGRTEYQALDRTEKAAWIDVKVGIAVHLFCRFSDRFVRDTHTRRIPQHCAEAFEVSTPKHKSPAIAQTWQTQFL